MAAATQYVSDCIRDECAPRVKELSAALGIQRSALSRAFSRAAGMPVTAYFRARQIAHACALLAESAANTTRVGYACGFETRATFYRVFRLTTGMTPAQFRAAYSERGLLE